MTRTTDIDQLLTRHYHDVADTTASAAQIGSILQAVAATRQRPVLLGGWARGRAWPGAPSSRHRTLVALGALVALLLALAAALIVGSRPPAPAIGLFLPTGSLPSSADGAGACAWCRAVVMDDGRVLVVAPGSGAIYDPVTWTFSATRAPSGERPTDAILLEDGRVLLTSISRQVEIYDPSIDTWRSLEHPSTVGAAAVNLPDGRVLILGTEPAGPGPGAALTFDPSTDRFAPTGPMLAERDGDVRLVPLDDGRVLVVGGSLDGSAEIFDASTDTFAATGSTTVARGGFAVTRLADGRVLIIGGQSDGETLASAELYDPAKGTFTPTGSMETPRFWHTATLLPDGRVLVVGGSSGRLTDTVTSSELYDPRTGRFTSGPATTQPRVAATAIALPEGVLVLGHYPGNVGGNRAAGRTAEVFVLGPVERPAGCCLDKPDFVSVSATADRPGAGPARLVVPAGALDGAVSATLAYNFQWSRGGYGGESEMSLPACRDGCSIPVGPSGADGSETRPEDAILSVTVGITYEDAPPPAASGIEVVIDTEAP